MLILAIRTIRRTCRSRSIVVQAMMRVKHFGVVTIPILDSSHKIRSIAHAFCKVFTEFSRATATPLVTLKPISIYIILKFNFISRSSIVERTIQAILLFSQRIRIIFISIPFLFRTRMAISMANRAHHARFIIATSNLVFFFNSLRRSTMRIILFPRKSRFHKDF